MKTLLLLTTILFLAACANNNPYGNGSDNGGIADLPPIGVFYSELNESLRGDCLEFRSRSMLHYCRENSFDLSELAQALSASGRFNGVIARDLRPDYQILVSSAEFQFDGADSMAGAVVSGASLMLIPMKVETTLKTEFTVMWRGNVVDRFSHEMPVDHSISLFTSLEAYDQNVAKALAEAFLKDVDTHNSMSASRLVKALDASDYEADVIIPEELAEFRLTGRHLYRDPFLGTMLSFNHHQFTFDRIDVFIYPIRATDWNNTQEVIEGELESVRAEIKYIEQEGHINNVELGSSDIRRWTVDSTSIPVGFTDGYYVDAQSERLYTSTYVFIQEDKFVKVRASFPKNQNEPTVTAPDDFVRALIPSLTVPEESLFMARLRKSHRDTTLSD